MTEHIEASYSAIEIKVAQDMAFAGRARNDVSEDALEYWLYTGDETKAKDLKQARAAIQAYQQAVASEAVGYVSQANLDYAKGRSSATVTLYSSPEIGSSGNAPFVPIFAAPPASAEESQLVKTLKAVRGNLIRLAWEENSLMIEEIDAALKTAAPTPPESSR